MVTVNGLVAVCWGLPASLSWAVKLKLPRRLASGDDAVAGLSVRPAGRDPSVIDQVYAESRRRPRVSPNRPRSRRRAQRGGRDYERSRMVMFNGLVAVCWGLPASLSWAVKLKLPAAVGVPAITPLLDKRQARGQGSVVIDQVYGRVPPPAASVAE